MLNFRRSEATTASFEVEGFVLQVIFDLDIFDGRLLAVEHRDFFGDDVEGDHFVVLGEEDGVGEPDVAGSGDGYFYRGKVQGTRKIRFDAHT